MQESRGTRPLDVLLLAIALVDYPARIVKASLHRAYHTRDSTIRHQKLGKIVALLLLRIASALTANLLYMHGKDVTKNTKTQRRHRRCQHHLSHAFLLDHLHVGAWPLFRNVVGVGQEGGFTVICGLCNECIMLEKP